MKHFIPAMVIMLGIYAFSAMPAPESSKQHGLLLQVLSSLGIDLFAIFGEYTVWWVRKTAHFTLFGTLSLCYWWGFFQNQKPYPYTLAWIMTFLYAITDEVHQYFVPERGPSAIDVLIDSLGALTFLSITKILSLLYRKLRNL